MKENNTRDNLIDITKFIASIFVVIFHTELISNSETFLWQFDVILRLPVPFFIICSGYYLGKRCIVCNKKISGDMFNRKIFFSFIKRIGILYTVWSVVYLVISIPQWIETGWFSGAAFLDWILAFFVRGSYYHLWYLLFMLYAIVLLYSVGSRISTKYFPVLIGMLYLIEVIQYGYRMFLPEILQNVFEVFDKLPCISAITRVLPFLLMGMYISSEQRKSDKFYLLGFCESLVIVILERNFLVLNNQRNISYIFGMLPVSYFLFQFIINHKKIFPSRNFEVLGRLSTYIYVIHPLFILFLQHIMQNKIQLSLSVIVLSIISSVILIK